MKVDITECNSQNTKL